MALAETAGRNAKPDADGKAAFGDGDHFSRAARHAEFLVCSPPKLAVFSTPCPAFARGGVIAPARPSSCRREGGGAAPVPGGSGQATPASPIVPGRPFADCGSALRRGPDRSSGA